jgi:hypothetical protein
MNVQVVADAAGRLVWASAALPGSAHDLTAARTHAALINADVMTFADKAYQGAGGSVRTPLKRHRYRPKPSRRQKAVNKAHARIRCHGERAVATLKPWKILTKLRCSPSRTTAMVQAILVLPTSKPDLPSRRSAQPCRPTLVMSCRARTRHTYDGT